jgi:hypothetical protein
MYEHSTMVYMCMEIKLLDFGTRRQMVGFIIQLFYSQRKSLEYPLDRRHA